MPQHLSRLLVDVAIAIAVLAATLGLASRGLPIAPGDMHDVSVAGVLLALTGAVALPFHRRRPAVVFVVAAAADTGLVVLGYRPGFPVATAVALYYLASDRPLASRTLALAVGGCAAWALGSGLSLSQMFHGGLAIATAWFAGERARMRREQLGALEERAHRAEREAENERRLAVAEERARIARDLHDSAGHAINVIGVLAGAARLRGEPAGETLETIETIARDTVGELDGLLRALREGDAETTPTGLASLDTLLSHHTACGLDVTLRAAGPARPLAGSVDQAAYRILQEALTNAARHGTGSARVDLAFRDAGIELTVVNPVPAQTATRGTGGHGLIGMRERAALTGGALQVARLEGSFRVHAELPYACQAC